MTTGASASRQITAPVSTAHREMPIRVARTARTCARPPRSGCRFDQALLDTSAAVDNEARGMEDELPSVSMTMRFLDLCDHYGSPRAVVGLVAAGRKVGVSGLPARDAWPAWDADEMQAAVKYLEEATNRDG